ncbi:MAG: hypothetical protein ABIS20_12820 [Thermoanaerobaculia bacterium]
MRAYETELLEPLSPQPLPAPLPMPAAHPEAEQVERFLRGELTPAEVRAVVRHLLTRCPRCAEVAGRLWKLGDPVPLAGLHE